MSVRDLPQDMTSEEKEAVEEFINNGCPGIMKIQQGDIFKFFELYMSGKTYAEISVITKNPKSLIMYLAYKSNWLDHRLKHYENISLNILEKVKQVKLDTANNLVTIIKALGKYCETKYNKYLSTNNPVLVEDVDPKIVTQYYKSIELLDKILDAEGGGGKEKTPSPMVNINMGIGAAATIAQPDPNKLEITDQTAGELLKALADIKKMNTKS